MSSANIIRAFANYCKERKVEHSVIIIEGKPDRSYIIYDKQLVHQLNGEWVIVRRYDGDLGTIYLFDLKTDSFLGVVNEHLDVAGDRASSTDKDEERIGLHVAAIRRLAKYRKAQFEEVSSVDNDSQNLALPVAMQTASIDMTSKEDDDQETATEQVQQVQPIVVEEMPVAMVDEQVEEPELILN